MSELENSLQEVMGIQKYRGCLITPDNGKWIWGSQEFDTLDGAKKYIDEFMQSFKL